MENTKEDQAKVPYKLNNLMVGRESQMSHQYPCKQDKSDAQGDAPYFQLPEKNAGGYHNAVKNDRVCHRIIPQQFI